MSTLLLKGSKGSEVTSLQNKLVKLGYNIKPDGDFGGATYNAVVDFQTKNSLGVDGKVGNGTMSAIDTKLGITLTANTTAKLTDADYTWAAGQLGTDIASIKTVSEVESPKGAFLSDGRPPILYERHVMVRRLKLRGIDPAPYINSVPDLVNTKSGGYTGGASEYDRLARAMKIEKDSALESCSWGAYQILGQHWKALGYSNVSEFVTAMSTSARGQLEVFVRFIKIDPGMNKALRNKDWADFASRYNGPNYIINKYDEKLNTAYRKYS